MSFTSLYRASFYLMLIFATLVLSIDAIDSPVSPLYPVIVAAASVAAFLTVDRNPALGLSPAISGLCGLAALGLAGLEWLINPNLLLLALGHWLVYLQLIYMFREKTVMIDWWTFILGLVQVMVGTVISQSDTVGVMLFAWAVMALWVLGLFSLRRDANRATAVEGGPRAGFAATVREPYPGLLNLPFLVSALRVTLFTLVLGGVIFLAMPRRASMARSQRGDVPAQHLTGFDDEVQLGQMGEILENDTVVMSVELFDEKDRTIAPEDEPLWRGVTMVNYVEGRWFRQLPRGTMTFPVFRPQVEKLAADRGGPQGIIRQVIKLESNDSNVLFGLRPMIEAVSTRRFMPQLNPIDGTIFRFDPRPGTYDYEVRSYRNQEIPQAGEQAPHWPRIRDDLLGVPERLRAKLKAIAEEVIEQNLKPEDRDDPEKKARALESYLRDSGKFGYTLKLEVIDRNIDPVEDFLVNRREGHCEYFASALALLLRSVKIPSRMVNGFKGGDWNDIARVLSVRQKHAHSWVEAYLGEFPGSPEHVPRWMTLDPTPGIERDKSVARVGGFRANFRQITDLVRYVWVFYVVGYNAERQNRLIYGPMRQLVEEAQRGFRIIGGFVRAAWAWVIKLFHFESARSFFSPRGFAVSFVALLLLVGLVQALAWLIRRLLRWYLGPGEDIGSLSAGATHYRRLAQVLAEYDLERSPAETQDEFARRATHYLTARGSSTEAVADVPKLVVDAFYRVRFGHQELGPDDLNALETRLDALETSLRAAQA
jgi:transglutaminase-like putative cysteine protease